MLIYNILILTSYISFNPSGLPIITLLIVMAIHLFYRLDRLDYLIRTKTTDTPTALAKRLGISVRALYEFLDLMRALDAPISYCKKCKSYYYTEPGEFNMHFKKFKPNIHKTIDVGIMCLLIKMDFANSITLFSL